MEVEVKTTKGSYSEYYRNYYIANKDAVNSKRREYARLYEAKKRAEKRSISPPNPVGRPRKSPSTV